jgi:nucleoid DNA-binding protein
MDVVRRVAQEMNMPVEDVKKVFYEFFLYVKNSLSKRNSIKIRYFGTFYFHKKILKEREKRRKEIEEYNARTKQMLCNRRRRARQRKLGLPRT